MKEIFDGETIGGLYAALIYLKDSSSIEVRVRPNDEKLFSCNAYSVFPMGNYFSIENACGIFRIWNPKGFSLFFNNKTVYLMEGK